jgi:hypothetical protein
MGPPASCVLTAALLLVVSNTVPASDPAGGSCRPDFVRIPLLHRDELDVFARVRIGVRTVDVVVDTGSSETWVAAAAATDSPEVAPCTLDEQHRQFSVEYGGGRVTGHLMRCSIQLITAAPHTELTLPSMWVGDVARDAAVLDEIRADGVLGFGMEALQQQWEVAGSVREVGGGNLDSEGEESSNRASHKPLLVGLLAQSGQPLVFSIFIRPAPHREEYPASQLILGGVDSALVSPNSTWSFFPAISYSSNGADGFGFWAMQLCSMALGDESLLSGRQQGDEEVKPVAVLDSGSSLLLLPPLAFGIVIDTLSRELGTRFSCSQREHSAFQSLECDCRRCSAHEFPDLTITLGSSDGEQQALVLRGADYVWCGRRRPGECSLLLDVDANAADYRVVLGAVFLRAFYTAFDYSNKRISLARPVHHDSDSFEPPTDGGWRSVAVALVVLGGSMATLALISTLDAHRNQ